MRRLTLKSESLTDLTADELADVAGAAPTDGCLTYQPSLCGLCQLFSKVVC